MSQQTINTGTSANDGTGDQLRTAFIKVNANFSELYGGGPFTGTVSAPLFSSSGASAGFLAVDRSTSGSSVFYRASGITYLYDSTYGNVLSYDTSGNVNVISGTLKLNGTTLSTSVTISGHLLSLGGTLSLVASDVGLGSVTNDAQTKAAIVPNTAPSAGQILVGNAGGTAYAPVSASGDVTISSTGAHTLASTAVTPASYGGSGKRTAFTVDAKGRLTAASDASMTASDVGLGSVTNDAQTKAAIVPNTAPGAGQILVGNAGGTAYAPVSASGDVTIASTGAHTIANAAVSLAKMANLAANSIIGNNTGSPATPIALTTAQTKSLLAITSADVAGTTTNDSASAGYIGQYAEALATNASSTVTISNASPAVVSWTAHGQSIAAPVVFTTTGSLPTGLSPNTTYYISSTGYGANSFSVSTTIANAIAGTNVNTSSAGSGTHSAEAYALLTNNTSIDIIGLSLTAGDWNVWGTFVMNPNGSTSATANIGWISTTSATAPSDIARGAEGGRNGPAVVGDYSIYPVGMRRLSLSSTTTVYLSVYSLFTVSTNAAYGFIGARRVR